MRGRHSFRRPPPCCGDHSIQRGRSCAERFLDRSPSGQDSEERRVRSQGEGRLAGMMDTLQKAVYAALHDMGYDPDDEEMAGTPQRWVSFLCEVDSNRERSGVSRTYCNSESVELMVQSHIAAFSLCAQLLVSYYGVAHVGYLPTTRICGFTKLSRLV